MGLIEDFYEGDLTPGDRTMEKGSPLERAAGASCAAYGRLWELLEEGQRGAMEAYLEAQWAQERIAQREEFAQGFRLGARMMLEILKD